MSITSTFGTTDYNGLSLSATGGTQRVSISDSGLTATNGNIGSYLTSTGYPSTSTGLNSSYPLCVENSGIGVVNRGILLWNTGGFAGSGSTIDFTTFNGATPSSQIYSTDDNHGGANLSFTTRSGGNSVQPTERFRINSNNNVTMTGYMSIANGITTPGYPIDFGGNARDRIIALYQNSSIFCGIGANNSALEYLGNGSIGLNTGGNNGSVGNTGLLVSGNNTISAVPGAVVYGGSGSNTLLSILDPNMGAGSFNTMKLGKANNNGNSLYINFQWNVDSTHGNLFKNFLNFGITPNGNPILQMSSAQVGVGGVLGTNAAVLYVQGSQSYANSFTFFVNGPGAVTLGPYSYTGTFSARFSSRMISTSGFYGTSDVRMKKDILPIETKTAFDFLHTVKPRSFRWKTEKLSTYGYIAQEVLSAGFPTLVEVLSNGDTEEYEYPRGCISPAGTEFKMNYRKVIPILHTVLKSLKLRVAEVRKVMEERGLV